jgi:DNA polymerase gamma 1
MEIKTKQLDDGRTAYFKNGKWIVPISKERKAFLKSLRDLGKVINFSALYGSGAKGLATFIQKEFPEKEFRELMVMANRAISSKKGKKDRKIDQYVGGTDSGAFNMMESIALHQKVPALPCLGTKITTALRPAVVGNDFVPGRLNWAIQATGAEILSITLVAMHWLCHEHKIPIRFVISIHDEVWFMTPEQYAEQAAGLFQICHLYVWSLFNHRLDMNDLALNNAFFSGVAVDDRIRKSADECTVTPSNPSGSEEPPGKEWTAADLEEAGIFKKLGTRLKMVQDGLI